MNYRHIAVAGALICTASMLPPPASAGEPRAVIELFTSQGCSSCPAADKVLGELARDPTLLTMSLPVDYWDYLGWKDTLALHGHSDRERAYADTRGDRAVFTPQVVVNGVAHVLGSDKTAIENAIAQTRHDAAPLTLALTMSVADGTVTVNVPAATDSHSSGEVWLCPITGKAEVAIGRGENRATDAAQQAIASPLLDNISVNGATGVLVNITGGDDLTLAGATIDNSGIMARISAWARSRRLRPTLRILAVW